MTLKVGDTVLRIGKGRFGIKMGDKATVASVTNSRKGEDIGLYITLVEHPGIISRAAAWQKMDNETSSDEAQDLFEFAEAQTSEPAQAYPDDNPKTVVGSKKPAIDAIPPVAILQIGLAMADGKRKYGPMNWREKTVSSSVYYNAAMRHLMAWWDGENLAPDSGVHHLSHAMACMAIVLDAESVGKLNDDRPIPGNFGAVVETLTVKSQ